MLFGHAQIDGRGRPTEDRIAIRKLTDTIDFFAVFDGHSGSAVARMTADLLPKRIQTSIEALVAAATAITPTALSEILRTAFIEHDKELARNISKLRDSGSTATVALVTPTHVIFAYAGDSPAFIFNPFTGLLIHELGKHEPTLVSEAARIQAAGGTVEIDEYGTPRVDGSLMVSRAFGDFSLKFSPAAPPPFNIDWTKMKVTAAPDVVIVERPQIGVMAIMSDGLVETSTHLLKPLNQVAREFQISLKTAGFNLTNASTAALQRHVAASVGSAGPGAYDGDDLSLILVDVGLKAARNQLGGAAVSQSNVASVLAAAAAAAARPKTRKVKLIRRNKTGKKGRLLKIFTLQS